MSSLWGLRPTPPPDRHWTLSATRPLSDASGAGPDPPRSRPRADARCPPRRSAHAETRDLEDAEPWRARRRTSPRGVLGAQPPHRRNSPGGWVGEPRAAPARPMLARASGGEACGGVVLRSAREPRSPLRPDARSSDARPGGRGRGVQVPRSYAPAQWLSAGVLMRAQSGVQARSTPIGRGRGGAAPTSRNTPGGWVGEPRAARAPPMLRRAADGGVGGGVGLRSRAHLSVVAPRREALSTLRTRCVRNPAHGRLRLRSGGGVGAQPPHQETVRAGGWGAARSACSSDARAATQAARRLTAPGGAPPAEASALHAGQQETVRGGVVRQRTTAGRRHLRARLPGRVGGLAAGGDAHLAVLA